MEKTRLYMLLVASGLQLQDQEMDSLFPILEEPILVQEMEVVA